MMKNKNKAEFEHARQQAINILQNTECENVVKSILFILGDYGVAESEKGKKEAEERANYLTGITFYAVSADTIEDLQRIYTFSKAIIEINAEMEAEKGGETV